jgi:hypothetical protein
MTIDNLQQKINILHSKEITISYFHCYLIYPKHVFNKKNASYVDSSVNTI